MKRLVVLALTAVASLLSGCATYDDYSYYGRDGYYDDRYDDRYYGRRYYYDEWGNRVYIDEYDVANRYGSHYGSAAWGYPDYVRYNFYYSALWPAYRHYYDPFWSPGFYYGVTFFPRTYFGTNVGWNSWPYYQAYSPYRHSHADHYYDWAQYSRHRAADRQRDRGGYLPRYGSARNEAQILARRTGARDHDASPLYYGASGQPGSIVDPELARTSRARGQPAMFERGLRDRNDEPYGPDGRGYEGFTRGARPAPAGGREYQRSSGHVAPAPAVRSLERGGARQPYRDPRIESSQDTPREFRDRVPALPNRDVEPVSRQILPRQTREPYDPVFERHVGEAPQLRSREVLRGREVQMQPRFQPSMPIERSEPAFQRSEPRSMPSYERSEPRMQPRYERPAPSFESRSAPSGGFDSGRGRSSSSSDEGSAGRSSRGQLERIIRDDD